MKTKRNLIIAVCLCLSNYCLAERTTFQDRTENWLQNTPGEYDTRPEIDEETEMQGDPGHPGPVGDAIWLVVGMSAVYALYRCRPKRKALLTD
jgi:hypothetical protein